MAIIDQGQISAIGTTSELKAMVGEGTVIEVEVDCPPSVVKEFEPIIGEGKVTCDGWLNIIVGDPNLVLHEIVEKFVTGGRGRIHMREPSLEDVFLKITGRKLREDSSNQPLEKHTKISFQKIFFWRKETPRSLYA